MSNGDEPYQVMDPLSDDEYDSLKADIRDTGGLRNPVKVDENGDIIDGHHRVRACEELGIEEYDTETIDGLSHGEKRRYAWKENMQRRHLDGGSKRDRVKHYLTTDWDRETETGGDVADLLGVSTATVSRAKSDLGDEGVEEFSSESDSAARDRIAAHLEDNPYASNRAIAEETNTSHPTVAKVKNELYGGDGGDGDDGETESVSTETVSTSKGNHGSFCPHCGEPVSANELVEEQEQ